ncbi:trypsin-like serine protease [Streptomyces yaizuensis]|uniref:S1 family peptidase n=1 Tax=Streptomyces yaizuensis TaxID=2989713 RepID=A0ABQ5NVI9_9ACTN|nr:trypsin-like serine protease [Streptomyces sp. YSPA8]GLF94267.1 S1 family peptidase [Streptomyces sp. YSPA8]
MKNAIRRSIALGGALALLPLMAVSAEAKPPGPLSVAEVAAMSPERQAEVLEPLRLVADAAIRVGLERRTDIYTQVEMASDYRAVNVYLTDISQGGQFIAEVRRISPKADTGLIDIVQGKKSRQALNKEVDQLTERSDLPFEVSLAGTSTDGGTIELSVDKPQAARSWLTGRQAAASATPVRVRQAPASAATPVTRWNDIPPFYAGAALGPGWGAQSYCTSGIPAISTWDGRQWLVTAGHCYGVGTQVTTAGGNNVGRVEYNRADLDAALIETRTNRFTWDGVDATGYTRYLNGVRNVAVGDFTCQLGYNSKVVCNIRTVYAGNAVWNFGTGPIRGSYGVPHAGGVVVRGGDSGGPVIYLNDPESRQLNGIVSAGWGCDANKICTTAVGWVDVWSIFNGFSLKLNPS